VDALWLEALRCNIWNNGFVFEQCSWKFILNNIVQS
jgi:hypothetical protein